MRRSTVRLAFSLVAILAFLVLLASLQGWWVLFFLAAGIGGGLALLWGLARAMS